MKVTSVDIYSSTASFVNSLVLTLSYRDPRNLNPYVVKDIVGLDVDEVTPKFYAASVYNDKFYDLAMKNRELVVQIMLNPNSSLGKNYSTLRDELFRLISSSRTGEIQLRFKDGLDTVAAISGFITKLESPQFTKSPEVHLTIKCSEPMLKALTRTEVFLPGLHTENTTINDDKSTAPHGLLFGVVFTEATSSTNFSISNGENERPWTFSVQLGEAIPWSPFVTGDLILVSSEFNNRYVKLIRGDFTFELANLITTESIWPILFPGVNNFSCPPDLVYWEYIAYYPTYWGV